MIDYNFGLLWHLSSRDEEWPSSVMGATAG